MKLYPECFDIKERREKHSASKEFGMSNDGYLLPCCWADGESWKRPEGGGGRSRVLKNGKVLDLMYLK